MSAPMPVAPPLMKTVRPAETWIGREGQAARLRNEGLGVRIEQAGMRHVDPERHQLAESRRVVRVEAADDLALADLQHRMGLGAGRLDDLDRRGQHRERRILRLQSFGS